CPCGQGVRRWRRRLHDVPVQPRGSHRPEPRLARTRWQHPGLPFHPTRSEVMADQLTTYIDAEFDNSIALLKAMAADAQHWAGELVSRFNFDRPGLAGIALTTDTSILTAIGNDYGYDYVFARQ